MKDLVIIFDLDGTLLNTDELIKQSFNHVFNIYKPGYILSEEEHLSFLGPKLTDSFLRYFPSEMIDELVDCYRDFNHSHHEEYVSVYPYVKETLSALKKQGYPLAVLTTKYSMAAHIGLELFDLKHYFDVIVCGDQLQHVKPHPEGVYRIFDEVSCHRGIMIGDNVSDLLTGKNASIYTIGVNWSPKGTKEMESIHPDLMIDRMDEVLEFVERIGE